MRKRNTNFLLFVYLAAGAATIISLPVFAADGNVAQVQTFIRSIIQVVAGLAGLIATGFFVIGARAISSLRDN